MASHNNRIIATLLWLPFLLSILCCGPGFLLQLLYRLLVTRVLRRCFRTDLLEPVFGLDAGFSTDSFWTAPKGGIAFVHVLSGSVDTQVVHSRIHKILDSTKAKRDYRRLTSVYPVFWLGYPFWKKVPENGFRLEDHIRVLTPADAISGSEDMKFVADWVRSPFKMEAPLWDILILSSGTRSLLMFRIHHMIGDGYSMLQFLDQLWDDSDQQHSSSRTPPRSAKPSYGLVAKISALFWTPYVTAEFLRAFHCHSDHFTKRKMSQFITLNSTSIALKHLKRVRLNLGLKLNTNVTFLTLIMHLVGSGLRMYLKQDLGHEHERLPHEIFIVASLPLTTSERPEGTFCNHWTHGIFGIPIRPENSMKRLEQLQTTVIGQSKLQASKISYKISQFSCLFPKFVLNGISDTNMGTPLGVANLPGPPTVKYLAGQEIQKKYAVVGLQWEHASIALGVFSYHGNVTITMMANQEVIPNMETGSKILNEYLQTELSNLMQQQVDEQV